MPDIEFALIQMKAETLDQINQALSRLDEGAYGYCLECGEEIPERRLRAPPFAIRCKDCEEALEVEERVGDRRLDGSSSGGGDNHDCFSSF
jgi:DnaK suppressor protein